MSKKLHKLFKELGLNFPTSEEDVIKFDNNNFPKVELPNFLSVDFILETGRVTELEKKSPKDEETTQNLAMVARKGEEKISKEMLDKMRNDRDKKR